MNVLRHIMSSVCSTLPNHSCLSAVHYWTTSILYTCTVNGELKKKYKHLIYKRNVYSYSVFPTEESITYKILET
jgi:hypothetical protein